MEADERYRFTLDGQLATVDDYLEVRPEGAARIRRLVEEGRLAIGPWQVLMDEFLVSGETIVRNLEYGQRRGAELGGTMAVGYLPDMFGHVAQMPQILKQAGIEQAVVWRGVPAAIDSHAFLWEAPDGSAVRAEYLPYGYNNAAYLVDVPGRVGRQLETVRASHRDFFGDDPVLAMLGTDHMEPAPDLADLVEESGAAVEISTLEAYLSGVDGRPHLMRWKGELRSSARANMLMGTLSARLDLKAAMARAERALARYAEPFQALYGEAWPDRLLDLAWRRVIENSAHDSICGCSVDEVSTQVLVRCAEAEQIAMGLADEATRLAAATAPLGTVVAFNPSPTARSDLVELNLGVPARWKDIALELTDGTRLAAQRVSRNEPLLHSEHVAGPLVSEWLRRRLHGRVLFGRRLNRMTIEERVITLEVDEEDDPIWLDLDELKHELDVTTNAEEGDWEVRIVARRRSRVVASVPAPALGWTALLPVEGTGSVDDPVRVEASDRLDNGLLSIVVSPDGTLALDGIEGVGRLVDAGDEGDSYNYAPPKPDHVVEEPDTVRVDVVSSGPVRGEIRIVRSYRWSPAEVPVDVETLVELRAGEPFCRVRVSFENPCDDHRLRFHVPLREVADSSAAEGQFAVLERGLEAEAGFGEVALPTFPAYGFVDAGGIAVLLGHPMEYELLEGRELAITLLRSTGLISRSTHAYRESPAGPELPIPDAQCRGPWSIDFALYPHAGVWHEAGVLAELERYRHPFLIAPGQALDGPTSGAGPELSGEGVVLSALRRSGRRIEATVACEHPEPVAAVFGEVKLDLRPWEIRRVELER
jgi:mannosylglycerate hydrolase